MNKIEITLVPGADGNVDVEATLAQARADVETYKAQRETEESTILDALNAVFDKLKESGTRANMPYVIGQALNLLGVAEMPTSYKTLESRVHKFLQANSQGKTDKVTKQVERPNSLFVIGKGKGGGIARRADLPTPEAAEEVAES